MGRYDAASVKTTVRCLALALNFVLLSSLTWIGDWTGGDTEPYLVAALLLAVLNVALAMSWDRLEPDAGPRGRGSGGAWLAILAAVAAGLLLAGTCGAWLQQILIYPNEPQRADQLIVVEQGIRRLAEGKNPYVVYHLPWDAQLSYGPVLWAPYVVPLTIHADIRFATLIGALFVPVACAIGALVLARRGRWLEGAAWIVVAAAICWSADLERFISYGHTAVYWPLLAGFAWLVAAEQWLPAAIAMGLLVVARTTMVAIVPVFWITVWHRRRAAAGAAVALTIASTAVPFLPFLVWDPKALFYNFYGGYQNTMKGYVWVFTTFVQHSIGLTGLLLSWGWQRAVEPIQILVMLATYGAAWRAIARGASPLPWMALALLAFSMTTLWPVYYLYFDVFLLLVCAALARTPWLEGSPRVVGPWSVTLALAGLLVVSTARATLPRAPRLNVGSPTARPYLRSGFSGDENGGDRNYAWIDGERATILLPRRSRRDATIEVVWGAFLPNPSATQEVRAALNGEPIGTASVGAGWSQASFRAPRHAWRIGVNQLDLEFSSAVSPREAGLGDDTRQLSVVVDRVWVETPRRQSR